MDAADVLYGVSMGGDGVTKVVSRGCREKSPRTATTEPEALSHAAPAPPPFAGVGRRSRRTSPTRTRRPPALA